MVKDGDGHKHFPSGTEVCQPVTTPEQPPGPAQPSQQQQPAGGDTSNPNTEGASNQNGGTGTEVAGATASKPGTNVLGEQLTQPETQGNALPRTGPALPLLAPIGAIFVAFGGLATAIARRR